MKKIIFIFSSLIILLVMMFAFDMVSAETLASNLKGKILLQVEKNGEAWYVNPANEKRYYMGRPDDAFELMRSLGVGITNSNLSKIVIADANLVGIDSDGDGLSDMIEDSIGSDKNKKDTDGDGYEDKEELLSGYNVSGFGEQLLDYNPSFSLLGKIFLQVEQNGEAWYVNPDDEKRYFLGRPQDAFNVMRSLGLGITNNDLDKVAKEEFKENLTQIDDDWNLYTNNKYGFSMKVPKKNDGNFGNIRVEEHDNYVKFVDDNSDSWLWTIYTSKVGSEEGLNDFLQERYGSACKKDEEKITKQEDVFEIIFGKERSEDCFINYVTKTFYNKSDGIVVSWRLGQAVSFYIDGEPVDYEMVKSFEFIGDNINENPLCYNEPEYNAMGRAIYPIYDKYKNLEHLGQFFTAYICGEERLSEIYDSSSVYSIGSTIWLKENPSQALINSFGYIGYECVESYDKESCKKWQLTEEVDMDKLFNLESFSDEFESDDCVSCG